VKRWTHFIIKLKIADLNIPGANLRVDLMNIKLSWFEKTAEKLLQDQRDESSLHVQWLEYRWESGQPLIPREHCSIELLRIKNAAVLGLTVSELTCELIAPAGKSSPRIRSMAQWQEKIRQDNVM
jgi:hypothetical protein